MQALQNFWLDSERIGVGNELARLFALQDKGLTLDKKNIFIEELAQSGYAYGAVVQGIRSLAREDLKTLKIWSIMEASRKFVQVEEREVFKCGSCNDGLVAMVRWSPGQDHHLNKTSFACICKNGDVVRQWKRRPANWNGQLDQRHNQTDFKRHDFKGIYQ